MKRGRPATTGIKDAVAIARKRGCVMRVEPGPDSVCDFFIRTMMLMIFVRVVRFEKIIAPAHEIAYECRGIIAELRLFPPSLQIRTELWIYTRHGTYRFFRLTDAGLEEIRQDGEAAPAAEGEQPPAAVPATGNTGERTPGVSPTEASFSVGTGTLPGHGPPTTSSGESTVGESGGGRGQPE